MSPPIEHHLSIVIQASVETVWEEITKTGRLQRAFFNTVLETDLRPGARLRYYSPDRKRVFVVGEVLEVEAPTRLVHTYMLTLNPEPFTTVTWVLEEVEGGCRVNLTHDGFTDAHKAPEKIGDGWKEILALLKSEVETGRIPLKTRVQYRVMGWLSFALPKSTTVRHADEQGW